MIDLYAELHSRIWAIQDGLLPNLLAKAKAFDASQKPHAATSTQARRGASRSIAVIGLQGTLMQRSNPFLSFFGGTGLSQFVAQLQAAADDDSIAQILIEIDSPGGEVYGTGEAAQAVLDARKSKPVVAISNSLAASAAYWIGSQADEFFCTPGGEVGSIGVYTAHEDLSKVLEASGVDVTLISAGKYKTEGNPYGPLDRDAKAHMQSRVDEYYGAFTRDVARGRAVPVDQVRGGMGQGRVLGAKQALDAGMIDGVLTRDQVVARMQRSGQIGLGRSGSAGSARRLLAQIGADSGSNHRNSVDIARRWLDVYK